MKCKKIILKQMYDGFPKLSDFEFVEEDVSEELQDGEILYETMCHSVDPYMRAYVGRGYKPGDVVIGSALARVKTSKSKNYKVGQLIVLNCGWRNGGKAKESEVWHNRDDMPSSVPKSASVGLYGIAGLTAYLGMYDIMKVKKGDTVFISGAAGAVGNVCGQIGKLTGCRVVGSCGTDEKVAFCKKIGYDDVFNYKTETLAEAIERVAPDGIDCYFDNVGGVFSSAILDQMNANGRVAVCGSISGYNATGPVTAPIVQPSIVSKRLMVKGFLLPYFSREKQIEAYENLKSWTNAGTVKAYETVTEGFDKIPEAFIGMLKGANIGKAVVRYY